MKSSSNGGAFLWVETFGGGEAWTRAFGIAVTRSGDAYAIGAFGGTVDFDPGIGTQFRTAAGLQPDAFLVRFGAGNLFSRRPAHFFLARASPFTTRFKP